MTIFRLLFFGVFTAVCRARHCPSCRAKLRGDYCKSCGWSGFPLRARHRW